MFAFLQKLLSGGRDDGEAVLDSAALQDRLAGAVRPLVIDVRTPAEFQGGHIPGAMNIPLAALPTRAAEFAAATRPLVVVCLHGARSRQGAGLLRGHGAPNVAVLDGGTSAWRAAGLAIDHGP